MLDYDAYVTLFNTGDDQAVVDRFYANDCVMISSSGPRVGRQGLLEFLAWAHDGVREVIRPQAVISQGNRLFAEVDMDFHAAKRRTDFPFADLHPGDMVTVKFFASYEMNDQGRIQTLITMTWPPEQGVTKLPRLGSHASQVAAFHSYAAAFSAGDCERFAKFYTEDVVLSLSSVGEMRGRQAIVDFYAPMFESVRETVTVESSRFSDSEIVIDAMSRFTAVKDAPGFVLAPLKAGQYVDVPVRVAYALRGGLICRITVTRNGTPGSVQG